VAGYQTAEEQRYNVTGQTAGFFSTTHTRHNLLLPTQRPGACYEAHTAKTPQPSRMATVVG
jgi:hypothetical protein